MLLLLAQTRPVCDVSSWDAFYGSSVEVDNNLAWAFWLKATCLFVNWPVMVVLSANLTTDFFPCLILQSFDFVCHGIINTFAEVRYLLIYLCDSHGWQQKQGNMVWLTKMRMGKILVATMKLVPDSSLVGMWECWWNSTKTALRSVW